MLVAICSRSSANNRFLIQRRSKEDESEEEEEDGHDDGEDTNDGGGDGENEGQALPVNEQGPAGDNAGLRQQPRGSIFAGFPGTFPSMNLSVGLPASQRTASEDFANIVNGRFQTDNTNFDDVSNWLAPSGPGESTNLGNDWASQPNLSAGGGGDSNEDTLSAMAGDFFAAPLPPQRSQTGNNTDDALIVDAGSVSDLSSGIIKNGRMSPSLSTGDFGATANHPARFVSLLKGHSQKVAACAFDFAGRVLATGGHDRKLFVWDVRQQQDGQAAGAGGATWCLEGHTNHINAARFSNVVLVLQASGPLPRAALRPILDSLPVLLASSGMDKSVRLYALPGLHSDRVSLDTSQAPQLISTFGDHKASVTGVDFCPVAVAGASGVSIGLPGGQGVNVDVFCASVDGEGGLKIWSATTGRVDRTINLPSKSAYAANAVRFRPCSLWMPPAPSSRTGRVRGNVVTLACSVANQLNLVEVSLPANTSDAMQRSPRAVSVPSVAGSGGASQIFQGGDEEHHIRIFSTPHVKNIFSVDWSNDGSWLITASEDLVCLWENGVGLPDGGCQLVHQLPMQTGKIASCIFLQDTARAGLPMMPTGAFDTPTSPTSLQGSGRPPRVALGEYDRMYIWDPEGGSVVPGGGGLAMVPALQAGNVGCLASVGAWDGTVKTDPVLVDDRPELMHQNPRPLVLAAGSSSREDNLRLFSVAPPAKPEYSPAESAGGQDGGADGEMEEAN